METLSILLAGFTGIFENPIILLYILLGTFVGIVFGAIPGLTAALGVTLVLPFTFAMSSAEGISLLAAVYVGGVAGGLISATLLNIPGTPASIVTCFDGAPMAQKGKPGDALALGIFSSLIGGLFSAIILAFVSPQLAKIALNFGSWEYFAMGIMGLSVVVGLCSKDIIKGLISAIIGILLSAIGIDPVSGVQRFTFGLWQLGAGFDILPTLMGLFAISEILTQIMRIDEKWVALQVNKVGFIPSRRLLKGTGKSHLLGSLIGCFVGILPGVGQSTASLLSYNTVRSVSKTPELFGTGHNEGIVASEAANNACCGGAMIPMLTLAIPGDAVTAILLGGLIVHGIQPGPSLFTANTSLVGVIFVGFILANIAMYAEMISMMKGFIKILSVQKYILYPILLVMCAVGSYMVNNRMIDCWVLVGVGIIGYLLVCNGFSLPPIVLGFVLGDILESNFRTAIIASKGRWIDIFTHPIAVGLLLFGFVTLCVSIYGQIKERNGSNQNSAK